MFSNGSPTSSAPDQPLSWLEIDLGRLDANVAAIRRRLHAASPGARPVQVCAVVKKDAYGLGASTLAPRLVRAGCEMLAVYSPEEAEALLRQGLTAPLLLLLPPRRLGRTDALYRHAVADRLHLTVHSLDQFAQADDTGRQFGIRMPVHLYLDTGMSRAGLDRDQLEQILVRLPQCRHVRVSGVYSHLATADSDGGFAEHQHRQFTDTLASLQGQLPPDAIRHLANTCGLLRDRRFHLDMVRPGLGLLGYGPGMLHAGEPGKPSEDAPDSRPALQPVLRWLSHIVHVQRYPAGTPVGYGSTHRLQRDSLLGVVPVGYGDGYPLALSNRACVRLLPSDDSGQPPVIAPLLGRVNMDQIVIDLTDVPAGSSDPQALLDTPVELVSNDPEAPNALPKLTHLAGTHCYEMLCRLAPHVPRRYVTSHKRVGAKVQPARV